MSLKPSQEAKLSSLEKGARNLLAFSSRVTKLHCWALLSGLAPMQDTYPEILPPSQGTGMGVSALKDCLYPYKNESFSLGSQGREPARLYALKVYALNPRNLIS